MKFKKKSDAELWMKVMCVDLMSSDESDVDEGNEVYRVHILPWRKESVKRMFNTLDGETIKVKSQQAKRQMKRRVDGGTSTRPCPLDLPTWAVIYQ